MGPVTLYSLKKYCLQYILTCLEILKIFVLYICTQSTVTCYISVT